MKKYEDIIMLVSRIMLSVIFIMAGFGKITGFAGTRGYMVSMGMTVATDLFLAAAIIIELGGGLSVLLGYKTKLGAIALFLFLIPVTLIFHNKLGDKMQMIAFLKNMAIMGGLLLIALYGAGKISIDGNTGDKDAG